MSCRFDPAGGLQGLQPYRVAMTTAAAAAATLAALRDILDDDVMPRVALAISAR